MVKKIASWWQNPSRKINTNCIAELICTAFQCHTKVHTVSIMSDALAAVQVSWSSQKKKESLRDVLLLSPRTASSSWKIVNIRRRCWSLWWGSFHACSLDSTYKEFAGHDQVSVCAGWSYAWMMLTARGRTLFSWRITLGLRACRNGES